MHKTNSNTEPALLIGIRPLLEAVEAGRDIDKIYLQKNLKGQLFQELWSVIKEHRLPYTVVPKSRLDKFTRQNHQGVLSQLSAVPFQDWRNVLQHVYEQGRDPLFMVLDRVSDVRNFGAIARSLEAAGADALIIGDRNSAAVNADAMKTSAGALQHLPLCREHNLNDTLREMRESGLRVIGVTEKAERTAFENDLAGPLALVMGAEDKGIAPERLKLCDELAKLPLSGKVKSLNVAVAAGAIIFETIRQRNSY